MIRLGLIFFAIIAVPFVLAVLWLWPRYNYLTPKPFPFFAERVSQEPVIHSGLSSRLSESTDSKSSYTNINGPSLIQVPDWLPNPLGKYYLYFAHHKGEHIRMAYADDVRGPWTVHEPGTLALKDGGFPLAIDVDAAPGRSLQNLWNNYSIYVVRDILLLAYRSAVSDQSIRKERGIAKAQNSQLHIASPEVLVDNENQRLLLYYRGLAGKTAQYTGIAESLDGPPFSALPSIIHSNYLRIFSYRGNWFGLAMPGILYRSDTGVDNFLPREKLLFDPDMRHARLWLKGDILYVFWSRVGDTPERILVSAVDLTATDWNDWRVTQPQDLLRAELPWERSELAIESSLHGELGLAANELRDPFVFEADGHAYLQCACNGARGGLETIGL